MPYGEGTEAELEQRQEAAKTHGAYAFERRGEAALNQTGRSRLQELKDQVQDRQGVLALMQERTAGALLMVELLTSFVAQEHKRGVPLSDIAALGRLPAFMNTAQRALKDLITHMPENENILDAVKVLEDLKGNGQED